MSQRNGYVPHDTGFYYPGVVAVVDHHSAVNPSIVLARTYKAVIFGETANFDTYEAAVAWCEKQKQLRAEAEIEPSVSVWGCSCNLCTRKLSSSIADEMSA